MDCQPAKVDADYFGEMDSDSDDAEIQPQEVLLRGCVGGALIAVAIVAAAAARWKGAERRTA